MSSIVRQINIPLFIKIEKNAIVRLNRTIAENGFAYERALFLYDRPGFGTVSRKIFQHRSHKKLEIRDSTQKNVELVIKEVNKNNFDVIFSCGGGRVLDVGKYAASKAKINFISIPTGPSNDGIASPIAVIKNSSGLSESLVAMMPTGIVVDLDIVKRAPIRNIRAGIGDLLSNFSAISDWQLAKKHKKEKIDDFAISLAYTAADFIFDMCLHREKVDILNDEFLSRMINGLILSGIAMAIAGSSRPCSGAEHMISHAMDRLCPNTAMHGEQVAVGTVIAEKMRGGNYKKCIEIFEKLGVPFHWKQFGFGIDEMVKIIRFAPKTRPGRYTVLSQKRPTSAFIKNALNY